MLYEFDRIHKKYPLYFLPYLCLKDRKYKVKLLQHFTGTLLNQMGYDSGSTVYVQLTQRLVESQS